MEDVKTIENASISALRREFSSDLPTWEITKSGGFPPHDGFYHTRMVYNWLYPSN